MNFDCRSTGVCMNIHHMDEAALTSITLQTLSSGTKTTHFKFLIGGEQIELTFFSANRGHASIRDFLVHMTAELEKAISSRE